MRFSKAYQPRYAVYTDRGTLIARYATLARALEMQAAYFEYGIGTHLDVN